MTYFPDSVMPKQLKREMAAEVDNDPLIINARDYNIHEREIRAIQQFLIGNRLALVAAGNDPGNTTPPSTSILDLLQKATNLFQRMTDGGLITRHAGVCPIGNPIPLPGGSINTVTSTTVSPSATTITLRSTEGFPSSGYVTKFNAVNATMLCSGGNGVLAQCPIGSLQYKGFTFGKTMSNQELIQYTGLSGNSLTGCTRGVNGTTAQQADDNSPAIVMCGKASVLFSLNVWDAPTGNPVEVYIEHNAMLVPQAAVFQEGTRKLIKSLNGLMEAGYSMTVIGWFDDVDVSQVFNLLE